VTVHLIVAGGTIVLAGVALVQRLRARRRARAATAPEAAPHGPLATA
jgi:hypothetical protein